MARHATDSPFLGQAIRDARKRLGPGKTQTAVGDEVGYGKAAVAKIERGQMSPNPEKLDAIAAALGTTVEALREAARRKASEASAVSPSVDALQSGTPETASAGASGRAPAVIDFVRMRKSNSERLQWLTEQTAALQEEVPRWYEPLEAASERATRELIGPALTELATIQNCDLDDITSASRVELSTAELPELLRPAFEQQGDMVARQLAFVLGTSGAGAALGAASAIATYTAVASFATASTGTAIASLSGAAAANATLAALGGGSLTAGGLGVAGGTAMLTGIVATPALLATGVAVSVAGRRLRAREADQGLRIQEAVGDFVRLREKVRRTYPLAASATNFLQVATQSGRTDLAALPTAQSGTTNLSWTLLSPQQRGHVRHLTQVLLIMLRVLPLPLLAPNDPDLTPDQQQALDEIVDDWNRAVLDQALPTLLELTPPTATG